MNTFKSVWECTSPPGIQVLETIKPSYFTGKMQKADGGFFGPCILMSRDELVSGRSREDKGEVVAGGGRWVCSALKLLSANLLRTEMCKGGDAVLLNCFWSLKPRWFSSASCLVEEEKNFVPHLLLWRLSAVNWAVSRDWSLRAHGLCMSHGFQSYLGSIFHGSFFLCFPLFSGEKNICLQVILH